jgi:hypothetical protein
MGGFVPAAALSALQMGIAAAQQERQADAAHAAAKADAKARISQMKVAESADDRQRQDRLRRTLASQRAAFAARGLGSGGSADAVLAGLSREAAITAAEQHQLNDLRVGQITRQLDWQRRRSLLDLADSKTNAALNFMRTTAKRSDLLNS